MRLINQIRAFLESLVDTLGYAGIAGVMFLEGVFPLLPSEMVMPLAGLLVSRGEMNFLMVVFASTLGAVAGTLLLYALGRKLSEKRIRQFFQEQGKYVGLNAQVFDKAQAFFVQHGPAMVFWARLFPVVRSPISIPAGLARMSLRRFLTFTTLGLASSNALRILTGVIVGDNWSGLLRLVQQPRVLFALAALAVLALIALYFVRSIRQRNARDVQEPVKPLE